MNISIRKRVFQRMTDDELRHIDRDSANVRGATSLDVDLLVLDEANLDGLRQALERVSAENEAGARELITDIDRWLQLIRHGPNGHERGRTVRQFADLVTQYIASSPGHRVYQRQNNEGEWLPYYVNHVEYENERSSRESYRPAQARIHMLFWRLGERHTHSVEFRQSQIDGRTVAEAMTAQGLAIETPDLRHRYLEELSRFETVSNMLGRQFQTRGRGYGLTRGATRQRVHLSTGGEPAKVVIDIIGDTVEDPAYQSEDVRPYFWGRKRPKANQQARSDELGVNDVIIDGLPPGDDPHDPEIPVHTYVPVYHLSHHKRYRIHVSALEEYRFNRHLGEQLVLPEITKNLIDVLVSQGKVAFRDIVEGKGADVCILLGGPPGTGKTLTAEVFAEATERPLLSVQAAQLGTSPDDIELKLQQVLRRGSRWNAVVLLDEADVYINERGGDIKQNAVVAAFLRVLENHTATIFMTTNRLDQVDDAVASRCLARIDYGMPTTDHQRRIWRVLSDNNATGLTDELIDDIVERHGNLSGRDIKQLLKLSSLWSAGRNEPITAETIDFAATFAPTRKHAGRSLNGSSPNADHPLSHNATSQRCFPRRNPVPDQVNPGTVHFANRPFGEPYACGLTGYPNGPKTPHPTDPERATCCAVCEAEAIAYMGHAQENLLAIFMGCGCEVTSYIPRETPGVVMAPHSCVVHGGYYLGECPDAIEYSVISASDDQVRQIWKETLCELTQEYRRQNDGFG